jgi:hypothetical protein
MRKLILAGAATLALAAFPSALSAQAQQPGGPESQTADEANAQAQPAPPQTTVSPNPGSPATVTPNPGGPATVSPNPGAPATVTTTFPGNLTPPPASAMNKKYPVCTRQIQDSCQNPGEGGAPGRSRALSYWPGEPASERKAPSR